MITSEQPQEAAGQEIAGRRRWTEDEDARLLAAVNSTGAHNWDHIAKSVGTRKGWQCRERFYNHHAPSVNRSEWTADEDAFILSQVAKVGRAWSAISKRLPGRTSSAVKNRCNHLLGWKRRHAGVTGGTSSRNAPTSSDCSPTGSDGAAHAPGLALSGLSGASAHHHQKGVGGVDGGEDLTAFAGSLALPFPGLPSDRYFTSSRAALQASSNPVGMQALPWARDDAHTGGQYGGGCAADRGIDGVAPAWKLAAHASPWGIGGGGDAALPSHHQIRTILSRDASPRTSPHQTYHHQPQSPHQRLQPPGPPTPHQQHPQLFHGVDGVCGGAPFTLAQPLPAMENPAYAVHGGHANAHASTSLPMNMMRPQAVPQLGQSAELLETVIAGLGSHAAGAGATGAPPGLRDILWHRAQGESGGYGLQAGESGGYGLQASHQQQPEMLQHAYPFAVADAGFRLGADACAGAGQALGGLTGGHFTGIQTVDNGIGPGASNLDDLLVGLRMHLAAQQN